MRFLKKILSVQNESSDAALLQEFKYNGNTEALGVLYMRYAEMIYGLCFKYFENGETARDEVMHIYESLAAKLERHEVQNFKSWVYTVAKNHCLMYLRSQKNNKIINIDPAVVQFEEKFHPYEESGEGKEQQMILLEKCMKRLLKDQQSVITLFYLQQKCYNEITTVTGFDWSRVRSLIQNGRRNLKICMEKNEPADMSKFKF